MPRHSARRGILSFLEQVHVRGVRSRSLRLELVAGLGIALAVPALALAAQSAQQMATQTTLTAETHDRAGRTQATITVNVTGEDGVPATGAVAIKDNGRDLAGVVLDAQGTGSVTLSLPAGPHQFRAVYTGDATHRPSASLLTGIHAQTATGTPDFQIAISPSTLTLAAGQSSTLIASITPENASALTGPMFVTLSCSGNPDQSFCTYTPENVEILPNATAPITSSLVFQTQTGTAILHTPATHRTAGPVAWAFLLPGALGLAGLSFGARRRRWLSRLSLILLVGLVTVLGTTGCNPLYYYEHHGPVPITPTPAGTYTVKITAQSTNGVTAITHSTTLALTVQ